MAAYTQTYTFSNGTTADGGQVNTEIVALGQSVNNIVNAQVDSSAAIAISKTTLGTYVSPTTFAGATTKSDKTTDTTGNVRIARYWQIGKQVTVVLHKTGMTMDSAANLWLTLPVTAATDATYNKVVGTYVATNGVSTAYGYGIIVAGESSKMALQSDISSTNWSNGAGACSVYLTLTYESS